MAGKSRAIRYLQFAVVPVYYDGFSVSGVELMRIHWVVRLCQEAFESDGKFVQP